MARSVWQRIAQGFDTFIKQVSRHLSDAWTAPTAIQPYLVELGVMDETDPIRVSRPTLQ